MVQQMSRALPPVPTKELLPPTPQKQKEIENLEEAFGKWNNVGFFETEAEMPWFAAFEKEEFYDGETVRLIGSHRSGLTDKTVTMLRLTDYWRRSVEKLGVGKQTLLRWLEEFR